MDVTEDLRLVRARTIPATEKVREDRAVAAVYDRRRCVYKYIGAHRAPLQLANPILFTGSEISRQAPANAPETGENFKKDVKNRGNELC